MGTHSLVHLAVFLIILPPPTIPPPKYLLLRSPCTSVIFAGDVHIWYFVGPPKSLSSLKWPKNQKTQRHRPEQNDWTELEQVRFFGFLNQIGWRILQKNRWESNFKRHPKAAKIKPLNASIFPENWKHGHVSNLRLFKAARITVNFIFVEETIPAFVWRH